MDELTIGDKIYISSKQAAKITGYAKDYVGQLCREGRVEAKLVGRNWYVLESSIREHRFGAASAPQIAEKVAEMPVEVPKTSPVSSWEAPTYVPVKEDALIPPLEPTVKPISPAPETEETVARMQDAWKEWFATRERALPDGEEAFTEETLPMVIETPQEEPEESAETPIAVVRESDMSSIYGTSGVSHEQEGESVVPLTRVASSIEEEYEEVLPVRRMEHTYMHPAPRAHGDVIDLSRARTAPVEASQRVEREVRRQRPQNRSYTRTPRSLQALILAVAGLIAVASIIGSGAFDDTLEKNGMDNSLRGVIFDTLRGESAVNK